MALVKCGECGRMVSDKAAACPGCGAPPELAAVPMDLPAEASSDVPAPTAGKKGGKGGSLGLYFVVVVLLVVGLAYVVGSSQAPTALRTTSTVAPAATAKPTAPELAASVARAQEQDLPDAALRAAQQLLAEHPDSPEAAAVKEQLPTMIDTAALRAAQRRWSYTESEDPMSSRKAKQATTSSTNEVEFGSPYAGRQRARLTLRRHPRHGTDVILQIERGQFQCGVSSCRVSVRFDEGNPITFSAAGPSDNSTETLFIRGFDRFLTAMRRAKVVRIQPPIYQQGGTVFEFDVSGFQPDEFKP